MVRRLAPNPWEFDKVLRLPLAEALCMYEILLREDARDDYQYRLLLWTIAKVMGGKAKAPEVPDLLKE
jgi:hypothetical protein